MSFTCKKCKKQFRDNYDLLRHTKGKRNCSIKKIENTIITIPILQQNTNKKFVCEYCDNRFTRKDSLNRHLNKSCKVLYAKKHKNILKDEEAETHWSKLSNDLEQMGFNCSKIDGKKYVQQNNHINIIKNEIHNHYTPTPYGESKKNHISDRRKRITLNNLFTGFPRLLKDMHGDICKPENLNLYMPNKREPYVKIFNGENWTMELLSNRLKYIIVDFIDMTDDYINEMGDQIPNFKLQKYELEKKACLSYCEVDDTDNKDVSRMIELFKLTMYNFKELIDETNLKLKFLYQFVENYQENEDKNDKIEDLFEDEVKSNKSDKSENIE
jgi:hypothetical protein